MEDKNEAQRTNRKPRVSTILLLLIIAVSVALTGWGLMSVSSRFQIPTSEFVTLPTTQLSTTGNKVVFVSVSDIGQKGTAVGVQGNLMTATGTPVAGAKVYLTYYLSGYYRTQVAITDQNGHFEAQFPTNWTGYLPVTLTYFGDDRHQGLTQPFKVAGEST